MNNDELMHYGVLGMKWGVRRDRATTISKAYNKLQKLDSDISKKTAKATKAAIKATSGVNAKYNKLQEKADKAQYKADKKKYGLFSNAKKADKLQAKADDLQFKANKYKYRAEKRTNIAARTAAAEKISIAKAEKWAKNMNKVIGTMKISELSPEYIQLGRKYLNIY